MTLGLPLAVFPGYAKDTAQDVSHPSPPETASWYRHSMCIYGLPESCWGHPVAFCYSGRCGISSDVNSDPVPVCRVSRARYISCSRLSAGKDITTPVWLFPTLLHVSSSHTLLICNSSVPILPTLFSHWPAFDLTFHFHHSVWGA